jgi:two-component system chemotaxis response regulator CheB
MIAERKIRVLVVDDSAVARSAIASALRADPEIEVVGVADDPYAARDKILELKPDILTLDVEMPRMDGITFLKVLQKHHPMPVIIISSIAPQQSQAALKALEAGAVDVLAKPASSRAIGDLATQLPRRVKAAAAARLKALYQSGAADGPVSRPPVALIHDPRQIILIGASTGGVEAVGAVLSRLPGGLPGICVAQHIPPGFSRTFAERLNERCAFEVREAADGDRLGAGLALIAPGDFHLSVHWTGGSYRVSLAQTPPVNYVRPSVDVLFESAARCAGARAVTALLTGMGRDGAEGMKLLHQAGAHTLAQDEETCVVYGMPRAAVDLGAVDRVLPLHQIAGGILEGLKNLAGTAA